MSGPDQRKEENEEDTNEPRSVDRRYRQDKQHSKRHDARTNQRRTRRHDTRRTKRNPFYDATIQGEVSDPCRTLRRKYTDQMERLRQTRIALSEPQILPVDLRCSSVVLSQRPPIPSPGLDRLHSEVRRAIQSLLDWLRNVLCYVRLAACCSAETI